MRASRARARGPLGRRRALERREQRRGEDVEGQGGRDRVAGRAEHRRARRRRRARPGGRAGPRRRARAACRVRATTRGRVVVAPGAGAGDHDHEVGTSRPRRAPRRAIRVGLVAARSRRATRSQPASRACAASISELVSRISPGAGSAPDAAGSRRRWGSRPRAAPGGPAASVRPRPRRRRRRPAAAGARSGSSSSVALTSSPIERTCWYGRDGGAQLGARRPSAVDVLAHDDRVEARRASGRRCRRTVVGAGRQEQRGGLARADGVARRARRCRPSRPRRTTGEERSRPDRRGGDAADRLGQPSAHGLDAARDTGRGARATPGRERLGGRDVADERAWSRTVTSAVQRRRRPRCRRRARWRPRARRCSRRRRSASTAAPRARSSGVGDAVGRIG